MEIRFRNKKKGTTIMKKIYLKPETGMTQIKIAHNILGASDVQTGGAPHDVYNSEDVTYSRSNSIWDDEE